MAKKTGRPSKYNPDYCDLLITHMRDGLSFESFGGVLLVSKRTLYDWEKAHPEFLDAKRVGESVSRLYWEKVGADGLHNQTIKGDDGLTVTKSINATIWIFNMKNRFQWRDKSPDEIREENGERPLRELSDAELSSIAVKKPKKGHG